MDTHLEAKARAWWNAHWTQSDGAAIASLAALLAEVEAAGRMSKPGPHA